MPYSRRASTLLGSSSIARRYSRSAPIQSSEATLTQRRLDAVVGIQRQPAPQVHLVRLDVDGSGSREALSLLRGQADLDLADDRARGFRLSGEHVGQILLVALRPNILSGRGLDELDGDAHARAGAQDRSFDDRIHPELSRDLGNRFLRVSVLHDRRSRDHAEILDLRQFGDELGRHPVDEELLSGVAGEVLKRKDCERMDPVDAARQAASDDE